MKLNSLTEFFQTKENNFIILATDQFLKETSWYRLTFREKKDKTKLIRLIVPISLKRA